MEIEIIIKFNQSTGAVLVTAPLDNKMLCYGMLEMARSQIQDFVKPSIMPAGPKEVLALSRKH